MVLNELLQSIDVMLSDEVAEVKLKEFVGHTAYQVAAGVVIGVINAAIMYYFVFI